MSVRQRQRLERILMAGVSLGLAGFLGIVSLRPWFGAIGFLALLSGWIIVTRAEAAIDSWDTAMRAEWRKRGIEE